MRLEGDRRTELVGRQRERATLERLVADALAGRSGVLVLRGEPGVGKTALLEDLVARSSGWHVARTAGVESEMELAHGGLHRLCAPMLDLLDRLPAPQRDALDTVFGRSAGPAPDRFMVGLAVLTLFAEVAEQQPLLCVVDDIHWLDDVSAQIVGFVGRRLLAERVALVCAARSGEDDALVGLPELAIGGLAERDARALLLDHLYGPLDVAVCDQIVAESHGNPLALLELPRTWTTTELAGGFNVPASRPVAGRIEQSYAHRLHQLPAETRLLVLTAAAEPLGDPLLLHRAAVALGLDLRAARPAADAGLFEIGTRVGFPHPLVRSAVYRSADAADRRRVHRALADATDAQADPDRRAWHLARATPGPGEEVAAELERSAGRAQARGGLAAAAAFLQRSVALTDEPARRAERALTAAEVSLQAGALDAALGLVATAEAESPDALGRARAELLRGQISFASGRGNEAPPMLLTAARRLEPLDEHLARETYLIAWGAAARAGTSHVPEISRAILALRRPGSTTPTALDLLLDGLALLGTEGHLAAAPTLRRAMDAVAGISLADAMRWGWMATAASAALWDVQAMGDLASRTVQLVREAGALSQLAMPLAVQGAVAAWRGDFTGAAALIADADSLSKSIDDPIGPWAALRLLALQGRADEATALVEETVDRADAAGAAMDAVNAWWAAATLHNGLGRHDEAWAAARKAASFPYDLYDVLWVLPELIEAAARVGEMDEAQRALERLAAATGAGGTEIGLGIEARSRAIVCAGDAAEDAYREAIDRLGRTPFRPELARAHLLYGEWLRREGRRRDARRELRSAHGLSTTMGMHAFADRAGRELAATGDHVRRHDASTGSALTPQEEQIARLASDGFSNPEIGVQLFISARTVEWHLRKVFTKLGISSRRQLRVALGGQARPVAPA